MSQYPPQPSPQFTPPPHPPLSPQQPQGYGGYYPVQNPRGPARRAGVLAIILGSLLLLSGGCCGLGVVAFGSAQMNAEQQQVFQDIANKSGISMEQVLAMLKVFAVMVLVLGVVKTGVGIWILGGSKSAAITGIILTGVQLLVLAWVMVSAAVRGGGNAVGGICMLCVYLGLLILLFVWLIQAVKLAPQVLAARAGGSAEYGQQYQQYWQHQQYQQQQAMQQQQPGYGYGYPQQPAPPPPPSQPDATFAPPPLSA
ncbi:MAG TPA: hypothetical protein VIL86_08530, partial [Tepidisphaeraceae bacterium]